jgi:tetratricopeptide (TPR) repeat protein
LKTLGKVLACCFLLANASRGLAAEARWQGSVPTFARDVGVWTVATERLRQKGYLFGAVAASNHLISLFSDIKSKELAYRTVIASIDAGYPVPVRDIFVSGDLEISPGEGPEEYGFYNSYYLYKAILSDEKKSDHWAGHYYEKIDKENFPKYLYYQAVRAYGRRDLSASVDFLNQALGKRLSEQPKNLIMKMTRMLARVHFERGEYEKALEIYRSFLLKLNPIQPSDWLEAAWASFHLRRYPETLGLLYNLESQVSAKELNLEKFSIRSLVYRAVCATPQMDSLIEGFEKIFKNVLDGIKRGMPYERFPELAKLELPENAEFNQTRRIVSGLKEESRKVARWSGPVGTLVRYLYQTELSVQERKLKSLSRDALHRVAGQVLIVSEQMDFLRFGIQRARFNPRLVFQPAPPEGKPAEVISGSRPDEFLIRWIQYGDYWLDERNQVKAVIGNRCVE